MKRLSLLCLSLLALPGIAAAKSHDTLWYESPASEWSEGLPIGNGRIGGMVFGTVPVERIQLNEESLWAGASLRCIQTIFFTI